MLDGLDGAAYHIGQRMDLWVEARSPLPRIVDFAGGRWRNLRLLSSAGNTYKPDYHGETDDGEQLPMMNTFRRDGNVIRHLWGSELLYEEPEPGQHPATTISSTPVADVRPHPHRPRRLPGATELLRCLRHTPPIANRR